MVEEDLMDNFNDDWILTRFGENPADALGAVVPPIYMNSLHVFDSMEAYMDGRVNPIFFYGRDGRGNPTVEILENKIAALERGSGALMFASGMAAVSAAILAVCGAGGHIIAMHNQYGPVKTLIDDVLTPKFNISATYVKGTEPSEFEEAIRPDTALILLESPSSLVFSVVDLRAVADAAKKHGVKTLIDNSYCTPVYQKPLEMGIDMVMHTASKYLGGHSDIIGGALVSKGGALMSEISGRIRALFGGIIGPMEGWLVLRGLRTLKARLSIHSATAQVVAEHLENHDRVRKVLYPGLKSHPQRELIKKQQTGSTGLISFELDADVETTMKFVNKLKVFQIGVSWGGHESLVIMPLFDTPETQLGIIGADRNLVRIHCGLEGAEALIYDLNQALDSL